MFVCSTVLDIMIGFQHYGGSTVHGFPIVEVLIVLILTRKRQPWPCFPPWSIEPLPPPAAPSHPRTLALCALQATCSEPCCPFASFPWHREARSARICLSFARISPSIRRSSHSLCHTTPITILLLHLLLSLLILPLLLLLLLQRVWVGQAISPF